MGISAKFLVKNIHSFSHGRLIRVSRAQLQTHAARGQSRLVPAKVLVVIKRRLIVQIRQKLCTRSATAAGPRQYSLEYLTADAAPAPALTKTSQNKMRITNECMARMLTSRRLALFAPISFVGVTKGVFLRK